MNSSTTFEYEAKPFHTTVLHGIPPWFDRYYAEVNLDKTSPLVLVALDTKDFKRWNELVNLDHEGVATCENNPGSHTLANNPLVEKHKPLYGLGDKGIAAKKGFEWSGSGRGKTARANGDFLVLMTVKYYNEGFGPRCWWAEV